MGVPVAVNMSDTVGGDADRGASSGRTLSKKNILRDAKERSQDERSEARDPAKLDSSRARSAPLKNTSTGLSRRSAGSDEDATSGSGSVDGSGEGRSEASTPSIAQQREVKMKRNCEACTVAKVKCSGRKPCKRCQARGEGAACIFLPKRSRWDLANRGRRKASRGMIDSFDQFRF